MPIPADAPLIVTAHLDDRSFLLLDAMRRRHFPVERNIVPAHVCLFHNLPGSQVDDVLRTVELHCRGIVAFDLVAEAPMFLGRGVAIRYAAGKLAVLRASLAAHWKDWLTPQDRQRFTPHVTIQNKVTSAKARALFESLSIEVCATCRVQGLSIWRYCGGPWDLVETKPFRPDDQYGDMTV